MQNRPDAIRALVGKRVLKSELRYALPGADSPLLIFSFIFWDQFGRAATSARTKQTYLSGYSRFGDLTVTVQVRPTSFTWPLNYRFSRFHDDRHGRA
jgi:hypothetical protein